MKTTELIKFEKHIEDKLQTIQSGDAKLLKRLDPQILAFKTIAELDQKINKIDPDKDAFIQLPSLACNLGELVLSKTINKELSIQTLNTKYFRCGVWMLDCLADLGIINLVEFREKREQHSIRIKDWDAFFKMSLAIPLNIEDEPITSKPLLSRPEEFKSFYHSSGSQLARRCSRTARRAMSRRNVKTNQVYNAINKQMQTGYRVNTQLLDVYNQLDLSVVSNLKRKNFNNKQIESVERSAMNTLAQANKISDDEFWCMMYYDFRGRLYQATDYMNYGSSKLAKSLFLLSEETPLGDDGLKWMKIHIANNWKWDKETLKDRERLVDEHLDEMLLWIDDVEGNLDDITQADDPYSFLAGLLELKRYLDCDDKDAFTTGLTIALDMTCSGLQVLSMLALDIKSAPLCNLLNELDRGDYYLFISDNVSSFKENPYWFAHRDKRRALVKRSAMTYFYSCGAKTMGKHIWNDFKNEAGFDALTKELCNELGEQIYNACRKLMPGPTKLMDLFIKLGMKFYSEGEQLRITMPTGFMLEQSYFDHQTKKVKVKLGGKRVECRIIVKVNATINKSKVQTASSPNIVHAFDAALLSYIITNCPFGIAVIHDSFASAPGNTQELYVQTRATAIELFAPDQLKEIGIDIKRGNLIINHLADNQWFAS